MIQSSIQAHIHYRHSSDEVAGLLKAIEPLHEQIVAVSTPQERGTMRRILNCNYFRIYDAITMRRLLLKTVKYTKANLSDYFPAFHPRLLRDSQILYNAITAYWNSFRKATTETIPTP